MTEHAKRTHDRWLRAEQVLGRRVADPDQAQDALAAMRQKHDCPPRCLAIITPTDADADSVSVAMAEDHWQLLGGLDAVFECNGAFAVSVHDLDEEGYSAGLLALLAFDETRQPTALPREVTR